jgi:hypothetical protein
MNRVDLTPGAPKPPGRLRKAVSMELGIWRSLTRWALRRRIPLDPGAEAFSYAATAAPIFWVFIFMSAIEIPILDLLMPTLRWRLIGLALGAWGVLWMLGLLASCRPAEPDHPKAGPRRRPS